MSSGPKHVYEIYIRTTKDRLWKAITDPESTSRYYYGTAVESDWKPGSPVVYRGDDRNPVLEGKVLEVSPGRKLVTTFTMSNPEGRKERPSRVTWQIDEMGEVCKLTLIHDDFDGETPTYKSVESGWNPVLSGLKTLLETGKPLVIEMPASTASR